MNTREEMEHLAATVAAATCTHLVAEKLLSVEAGNDFINRWTPVLVPRESVLKQLWERLFSNPKSVDKVFLIRFVELDKNIAR